MALTLAFIVAAVVPVSAYMYSGMERPYIASGVPLQSSGVYDRLAAYNYAQRYWDEVCSDSYFVDTRTTFIYLDPGTDVTGLTGFDCAHFVSCCIGNEPHEPGGSLDVPCSAHLIYGELGATQLGDWLINSSNGVEKATISELMIGDVINYDWDGDGHWDHAALYLGDNKVAGHTTSVWEADWQLIGAADYRFIHLLGSPWTVDDDGSADFHTIQEAINAANEGDTIFVKNGTYFEHVVVNKSVSLVGESRDSTRIEAGGQGRLVSILTDHSTLQGFTLENGEIGIWIEGASNNTISGNRMSSCLHGIRTIGTSWHNTIMDNILSNNYEGIHLNSNYNSFVGNTLIGNTRAINLWSWFNNITGNMLQDAYLRIEDSNYNRIFHNSFYNVVFEWTGLIHHDNFWDNGCEGNFWSDYEDRYPNASYDQYGIWNTSYVIDSENVDKFPLRNPYWNLADLNHDLKVDIFDLVSMCPCYCMNWQDYMCHVDIAAPFGVINIFDVVTVAINYGKEYTP